MVYRRPPIDPSFLDLPVGPMHQAAMAALRQLDIVLHSVPNAFFHLDIGLGRLRPFHFAMLIHSTAPRFFGGCSHRTGMR